MTAQRPDVRLSVWSVGPSRYLVLAGGAVCAAAVVEADADLAAAGERFRALACDELDGREASRADVDAVGRAVASLLFPDAVRERLQALTPTSEGLRVRVELPPELADLPVETVVLPDWARDDRSRPFVRQDRRSVVRTVPGSAPSAPRLLAPDEIPATISLLVVVAHADGCAINGEAFAPISAAAETARLVNLLSQGPYGLSVDVTVLGGASAGDGLRATRSRMRAWLQQHTGGPVGVAVLAHGRWNADSEQGEILLEDDAGSVDAVSGATFAAELLAAPRLRLAVLDLCSGGRAGVGRPYSSVAQEVAAQGLPAVVAMQTEISDVAATALTPVLLGELVRGGSLDDAVHMAREEVVRVRFPDTVEWAVPLAVLSPRCTDGVLFRPRFRDGGHADHWALWREAYHVVTGSTGTFTAGQVIDAARWARWCGDWDEVARLAAGAAAMDDPEARALLTEARIELTRSDLRRLAELLHDGAPAAESAAALDALRHAVPEAVVAVLDREVTAAAELDALYADADARESAGDWSEAAEFWSMLHERRPEGRRDSVARAASARRRASHDQAVREADARRASGDWDDAVALYHTALAAVGASGDDPGEARGYPTIPYGEVRARLEYCRGRIAEQEQDWDTAAEAFALAGATDDAPARHELVLGWTAGERGEWDAALERFLRSGSGAVPAAEYARARSAEAAGDWARAAEHFRGARSPAGDDDVRRRYCLFRVADAAGDAGGVLDGDPDLSDAYADGDVGHRRTLARARRVAAAGDRAAALAELDGIDDSRAGGDVGAARHRWTGELAELAGDWPAAAAAYAAHPDVAVRELAGRYARARVHEEDGDWGAAAAEWNRVDPAHRDARRRSAYAAGRAAEQGESWGDALGHYRDIVFTDRDVRARIAYCALREDPARVPDATLDDHPDGPALRAYLSGLDAERVADWAAAADAFLGFPEHQDAAVRGAYARARFHDDQGRWSDAAAEYRNAVVGAATANPSGPLVDVAGRLRRVEALRELLPQVDGLAADGLVGDPACPAGTVVEAAWLHPVDDPAALRRAQAGLTEQDEPLSVLLVADPADAPLLTLLAGGGAPDESAAEAESRWRDRVRRDPEDTAALHHLALRARWSDALPPGAGPPAGPTAAMCWAAVLADPGYRTRWSAVTGRNETDLTEGASAAAPGVDADLERHAALAVRDLGETPAHGPGLAAWLCRSGELADALERLAAGLRARGEREDPHTGLAIEPRVSHREPPGPTWRRLRAVRLAFSPFAVAAVAEAAGDLDRAAAELDALTPAPDLPFATPDDCAQAARAEAGHADRCPPCAAFLRDAPAYAAGPDRAEQLGRDGTALAVRIQLARAARSLRAARDGVGDPRIGGHGDLDDALGAFADAIQWGSSSALVPDVRQRIAGSTVAWVDDALRTGRVDGDPGAWTDASIVLLRGVHQLVGDREPLVARLIRLLYRRLHPDRARARADLAEALLLRPGFVDARADLVEALSPGTADTETVGFDLAAEAFTVLEAGADSRGELHPELRDALQRLLRDVADLVMRRATDREKRELLDETRTGTDGARVALLARADQVATNGVALAWRCEALRADPTDVSLRRHIADEVRARSSGRPPKEDPT